MAEEEVHKAKATDEQSAAAVAEVVVLADVPQPEKIAALLEPEPETDEPVNMKTTHELTGSDSSKPTNAIDEKVALQDSETTIIADLPDFQKKALEELKQMVKEALKSHEFTDPATPPNEAIKLPVESKIHSDESPKPEEASKPEKNQEATEAPAEPTDDSASAAVDDDGAKTVEAIEETIISVSTGGGSVPPEQNPKKETDKDPSETAEILAPAPEEVFIWGIRLMEDERSDVILLKFLRARDFKAREAFNMLKNTIRWRKEFGIDQLLPEEDLTSGQDLDKVVFMHGRSKEGHPVCYNVYGQFQSKELYRKTFSDEEKRGRFLRWRIQFLEKSIRKFDFRPGGISTIVQINDLKNSPGPAKWELRQATKQALHLLQDNYPEFVAKQVFINVPWWYLAVNRMMSPFLTQRTKSKFVIAGPSKSAETLFKYIASEQVPVQYGGLSKDGEFESSDPVTEINVKPLAKHTIEFPATQPCLVTWEVRVVGWDVNYGAEFEPSAEDGYTVIIQKAKRVTSTEQKQVICNSFKIGEPGKVVLTVHNSSSKKKKLLYRLKSKPSFD